MDSRPSQSIEELIDRLYATKGFRERLVQAHHSAELIRLIANSDEPATIPDLLPILIIGNEESFQSTARAIHRLVQSLKPVDFVQLDELLRQSYSNWHARRQPWYSMPLADVERFASIEEFAISLLGMTSSHSNGHIRESAIRMLGKTETGAELPFLLIRANDWVSEVRSLARQFLMERIRSDYIHHWMRWLSLALRLSKTVRSDHSAILDALQRLISGLVKREILSERLNSQDRDVRRFCFRIALDRDQSNLGSLLRLALKEPDIQIRREAIRILRAVRPDSEAEEILNQARTDNSAAIRREALLIFLEKYAQQADREFREALLDPNVAVRELAQSHFRKGHALDLRMYYSQNLETCLGRSLGAVLAGIGEVGLREDSKLVEPFLKNPSSKVREASVRAIVKLNRDAYLNQLLHALEDSNGKVAREAAFALSRKAKSFGGQHLWHVYQNCAYAHGKRWVLFLLAKTNKWDSINFLIQSLADGDDHCVEIGHTYIIRWFTNYNRSFVTPAPEQLVRLRHSVGKYGLLLKPDIQSQIGSLLKSL
jgi:HEAT repeat protein